MSPNGMIPKGGKREGAGRPMEALKERFQTILQDSGAYDRLRNLLESKKTSNDVFLRTVQLCLDRGYGKPEQAIKPVDDQGNYKPFQIFMPAQIAGNEGKVE